MKSKIAEKILSKTSEEDKQRVREYANNLVNKSKMKLYYLFNNRIWMANEKMPKAGLKGTNPMAYWLSSLQPCEISEIELDKVIENILNLLSICQETYIKTNLIEVTNIISDNNGVITFKDKEKTTISSRPFLNEIIHPKQVDGEIEAVEFAEWLLCNYNTSEYGMSLCWINADVRIATKHDTKQLYTEWKQKKI